MLRRWITGAIIGTALVAVTSPLGVRSYVVRAFNRQLPGDPGVSTLPAGTSFRWRSEGYATTQIGPHGMPGKITIDFSTNQNVALWGDSQAEGVMVEDDQKIFAIAEAIGPAGLQVFPLAQSGDDAAIWLKQFAWAEQTLSIDTHVFLIVELSDLAAVTNPSPSATPLRLGSLASHVPAFMIQAARNLIMGPDGQTVRSLRFSPGRVRREFAIPPFQARNASAVLPGDVDWNRVASKLAASTHHPIVLLYAPKVPAIVGGELYFADPDRQHFEVFRDACRYHDIEVIDLSNELRDSAAGGAYPHGFHNGVIGAGHLNAIGNQIVAEGLIDAVHSN